MDDVAFSQAVEALDRQFLDALAGLERIRRAAAITRKDFKDCLLEHEAAVGAEAVERTRPAHVKHLASRCMRLQEHLSELKSKEACAQSVVDDLLSRREDMKMVAEGRKVKALINFSDDDQFAYFVRLMQPFLSEDGRRALERCQSQGGTFGDGSDGLFCPPDI